MQPEFVNKGRIERPVDYAFENSGEMAEARYSELSALYDTQTIRHLQRTGIKEGWHCLEVGAGGGSIASWLCQRVG
ncbi:MAG TPA: SAM-dependent methyltransferase, partial [Terriglobales bacterium]